MAKYIDADRLRKAVEKKYNDSDSAGDRWDLGYDSACEQILEIIDSLQQEQPEVDLEKELRTYLCSDEYMNTHKDGFLLIASHFFNLGKLNARKEENR